MRNTHNLAVHVTPEIYWKMKNLSEAYGQSVSSIMREMAEAFCDDVGVR